MPLFAGKMANENTLYDGIVQHLEERRGKVPRRINRTSGWHPSGLADVCRRYETYKRVLPRANDSKIWPGEMLLRFEIGHAVHDRWQQEVLGKMRVLRGNWECSRCTLVVRNAFMPEDPCPHCRWQVDAVKLRPARPSRVSIDCIERCKWPGGFDAAGRDCTACERGGRWVFKESWIFIDELDVNGRYDGVLLWNGREWILELKTKDTFQFKKIEGPDDSHVIQANWYMKATGIPNTMVVYVEKNSGAMKQFELHYDPKVLEPGLRDIRLVSKAIEAGELPMGPCTSPRNKRAQKCPYADVCFNGVDVIEDLRNQLREEKKDAPK